MTTETTWRDEFDLVLKTIVLPGEFDILDETDRSRWLGALQQAYDAGRNKAEKYKEDAERYRWLKALAYIGIAPYPKPHEVWALRLPNLIGCTDLDAAIDKARKTT